MESPDAVERTQYLKRDRVHHLKEAQRDKERPFSKALREKMEEDLDEQRKRRQRDAVLIEGLDGEAPEDDTGDGDDQPDGRQEAATSGEGDLAKETDENETARSSGESADEPGDESGDDADDDEATDAGPHRIDLTA